MAARDLTGAVDFTVLETMTAGMDDITEEVLGLFVQQAALWSPMLEADSEGWRDAVHTIRGASAGIGANELAAVCAEVEYGEQALASAGLDRVRTALNAAMSDIAAYRHELMLRSLKG
jgi:HPt (histidine-containing phosphotransfer) domain-containing protein